MKTTDIKKKFYKLVNFLEECSDIVMANGEGIITEKGIALNDYDCITYGLDDNLIRFYSENKEIVRFGENNPMLLMFEDLIEVINEF